MKKKFKSKLFRKNNHFVLYDCEENCIYIDSFSELQKHLNYNIYDLVKQFNKKGEIIDVVVDGKMYQLYTFED